MNNIAPWVYVGSDLRGSSIPWLTQEESDAGLLYVATTDHKESFYQFCKLANEDERLVMHEQSP